MVTVERQKGRKEDNNIDKLNLAIIEVDFWFSFTSITVQVTVIQSTLSLPLSLYIFLRYSTYKLPGRM